MMHGWVGMLLGVGIGVVICVVVICLIVMLCDFDDRMRPGR